MLVVCIRRGQPFPEEVRSLRSETARFSGKLTLGGVPQHMLIADNGIIYVRVPSAGASRSNLYSATPRR